MAKTAISLKSVSEKTILRDLYAFVESHPEAAKWKSYLESSTGTTIMELLAAYGYFKFYHEVMTARESKLETAIMKSSIIELAFNRGLLLSPTKTGRISLTFMAEGNYIITRGSSIGMMADYDVIIADSLACKNHTEYTVQCYIGHWNEFNTNMYGFGPFAKLVYNTQDKYIASDMEKFTVNDKQIGLFSDLNYITPYGNEFCIRRVRDNEVRIYSGNGNLGFAHKGSADVNYQCISYGDDLQNKMSITPNLSIVSNFISYTILGYPDYSMTKEHIKGMAVYYPIDGRIVQDKDYEIAIAKYFGNLIEDVLAYNSDPNEEVYVLTEDYVGDGDKEEIMEMIDSRRGMGIQVFYHWYTKSQGKDFEISVQIKSENIYAGIENEVNGFFNVMLYKFAREDTIYYSKDFASQLSSYFEFPVYDRSNNSISLKKYEFLKSIVINITPIDNDYIYMDSELEQMKLTS